MRLYLLLLFYISLMNIGCSSSPALQKQTNSGYEYKAELVAYPIWDGGGASVHIKGPAAEYLHKMIKNKGPTSGIDCSKNSTNKKTNKYHYTCKFILTSEGTIVDIGKMNGTQKD